ncbi:hypothetical protein FGB62_12g442 [Gracilaria domingensis]|nr:hypothetical protein FGB62_12g442 [Gracilaria domingensis]
MGGHAYCGSAQRWPAGNIYIRGGVAMVEYRDTKHSSLTRSCSARISIWIIFSDGFWAGTKIYQFVQTAYFFRRGLIIPIIAGGGLASLPGLNRWTAPGTVV